MTTKPASLLSGLVISVQRWARANKVAVPVDVVDAIDRWPIFIDAEGAWRKAGRFARIRPVPFPDQVLDGMRRILQRIVLRVDAALLDRACLFPDREHGVAETIEFRLGLGLVGSIISVPATGQLIVGA